MPAWLYQEVIFGHGAGAPSILSQEGLLCHVSIFHSPFLGLSFQPPFLRFSCNNVDIKTWWWSLSSLIPTVVWIAPHCWTQVFVETFEGRSSASKESRSGNILVNQDSCQSRYNDSETSVCTRCAPPPEVVIYSVWVGLTCLHFWQAPRVILMQGP